MSITKLPISIMLFLISSLLMFLPEWIQLWLCVDVASFGENPFLIDIMRLVTYQFIHGSPSHLLGNFMFFMPFGLYLETKIPKKDFIILYLLSGVISALVFVLAFNFSAYGAEVLKFMKLFQGIMPLLGSSGAIFGLVVLSIVTWGKEAWWKALLSIIGISYLIAPQFIMALISQLKHGGIAYWGHVGGVFGALLFSHYLCNKKPLPAVAVPSNKKVQKKLKKS